jgi:hypothetical protein
LFVFNLLLPGTGHLCNPSYSGGRHQKDHGSKPARQIVCKTPISKNPSYKRAGGVAQGVDPEFKPQYHTHKKIASFSLLIILSVPVDSLAEVFFGP